MQLPLLQCPVLQIPSAFVAPIAPNSDLCLLSSEGLSCSVWALLPCAMLVKLPGMRAQVVSSLTCEFLFLQNHSACYTLPALHHLKTVVSYFVKCYVIFVGGLIWYQVLHQGRK